MKNTTEYDDNAAEYALAAQESEDYNDDLTDFQRANPEVCGWLNNYKGDFEFYLSVKRQLDARGFLSDKQREAVERAILRDNARATEIASKNVTVAVEWHSPTFVPGTTLKISKGVATKIAEDKGFAIAFRKVEVVATHRETTKAVLVTVKFSAQVGHFCGICGRGLTHPVSQATGIGPECADKLGITRYSMSDAKNILNEIGEKLKDMGEVKLWLPRSKVEVI